jgi:hypothetical protein
MCYVLLNLQMSNPAVKELLLQYLSIQPSPSKPPTLNAAPVNSPTAVSSPAAMRFSPTFLPGSVGAGSGAFSAPGRQRDRTSPGEGASFSRFDDAVSVAQPSSADTLQHRLVASGASPSNSSTRAFEAQIQTLRSKLNEELAARLASDAAANDLQRQLQARDAIIHELHQQLQLLEQQLFSVVSTLERSAEDALQVERSIRTKSGSSEDRRRLLPQQQQQQTQLKQDASPSRHASSNGSAFAPSSGSSAPNLSLRSPAVPSNQPAQASAIDSQSTTFIKVSVQFGCRTMAGSIFAFRTTEFSYCFHLPCATSAQISVFCMTNFCSLVLYLLTLLVVLGLVVKELARQIDKSALKGNAWGSCVLFPLSNVQRFSCVRFGLSHCVLCF